MSLFLAAISCIALWALAQWANRNIDEIELWLKRKAFQKKLKNQLNDFNNFKNCPCELCASQDRKKPKS
jgi:translation initiation factor 2 beta subunit (eIF-2beta)/eIF-5